MHSTPTQAHARVAAPKHSVSVFFTEPAAAHAARLDVRVSYVEQLRGELLSLINSRGQQRRGSVEKIAQLSARLDVIQAGLILRPAPQTPEGDRHAH